MKKNSLLILFLMLGCISNAQDDYSISEIPAELLLNANAVIRTSTERIEIKNEGKATLYRKFAVTILNPGGDEHADLYLYYDNFKSIKYIKGDLYDRSGKRIKSLKKQDVRDLSGTPNSNLADNNRLKTYSFNYKLYPYTVEYETSIENNGIFYFPAWMPVEDEHLSVMESSLIVEFPSEYNLRYKAFNYSAEPISTENKGIKTLEWKIGKLPAVIMEPYANSWFETTPSVFLAPSNFRIHDYSGNMNDWKGFGKFIATLNTGRDKLPQNIKIKVHQLTDDVKSTNEKIKILYSYLQQNTRYISVQFGIGGWQPFDAEYVSSNGYGDCKALSNYMYSLLKEAGIRSHYALIKSGNRGHSFIYDFPSNQFDHVILCIPQNNDTTWLECTSQTTKAGYLGGFTSNRNALIIDGEQSRLVRTPRYNKNDNLQLRKISSTLDKEGNLNFTCETSYHAEQQDDVHGLLNALSKESISEYLKDKLDIPSYNINAFSYVQHTDPMPSINEKLDVTAYNLATVTGKRIFITPNILNRSRVNIPEQEKRLSSIRINQEYTDIDSVEIKIPNGYIAENIFSNVDIDSKFGMYKVSVRIEPGMIFYSRKTERNSGLYPASDGAAFAEFINAVYRADRARIVLVKKE